LAARRNLLTYLKLKTTPIAEGADRFYGFDPRVQPTASLVEEARQTLAARPECKTLLVLPEGVMLNYLLRKPSTIPQFMFVPSLIRGAVGARFLEALTTRPPDWVALISRDMKEFGVSRFGDTSSMEAGSFPGWTGITNPSGKSVAIRSTSTSEG